MIVPSDKVWTFKEPLVKTLPVALQGTRQLKMKKKSENEIVVAINNNVCESLRTLELANHVLTTFLMILTFRFDC